MTEAIRLVMEEEYSVAQAALMINTVKRHVVPRMTLNDRVNMKSPLKQPKLGRPVELPFNVEQAIVNCLVLCAAYQYPMRRSDVAKFVQSYLCQRNIPNR